MKKDFPNFLLTVIFLASFSGSTFSQTIQIQGIQTGVLNADTILIAGNVLVPAGGSLTFLPGTKVIATGFFGFEVIGNIVAIGDTNNQIKFSVSDTTGFYDNGNGRGSWNGFHYFDTDISADSSVFNYCTFEYSKASGDSLEKMGGVFNIRDFDKIRISECGFNHNKAVFWGGAIFTENSNIIIHNSGFNDNTCGTPGPPYGYGGAVCLRNSLVNLLGCTFTENSSTGIGGAVSFEYSDVLVQSCFFHNNFSGLGGALGYLRSTPARAISGNLFSGNSSLFFGGAISCNRANPQFVNNTIAGNSSVSYGGAFYCNDSAVPVLINTIIYDNYAPEGPQVYIWDVNSAPEFYYCNIQGGSSAFGGTGGVGFTAPYLNNIDTLPSFSGSWFHIYSLNEDSPCINSGMPDTIGLYLPERDLAGNARLSGNRIDIGAYEFQGGSAGLPGHDVVAKLSAFPNPFQEQVSFIIPSGNTHAHLRINDMKGDLVFEEKSIHAESFIWHGLNNRSNRVSPGIYCATLTSGQKQFSCIIICDY